MLELNCSYEESKRILELGYDFSSICTKFECREMVMNNEEATTLTFLYSCGEIMTMWNPGMSEPYSYHLKSSPASGIIPLIPEAALEKCLPDYLLKKGCHLFYHVRKFMGELYWANCRDESLTKEWFSNFEAFIWCHENYPDELKAKFDEVMA